MGLTQTKNIPEYVDLFPHSCDTLCTTSGIYQRTYLQHINRMFPLDTPQKGTSIHHALIHKNIISRLHSKHRTIIIVRKHNFRETSPQGAVLTSNVKLITIRSTQYCNGARISKTL
jgi:hypothetical protein